MKKIIISSFIAVSVFSCSDAVKSEKGDLVTKEGNGVKLYYLTVEGENGDDSKQDVEFSINNVLVDSLKLKTAKIKDLCEKSVLYADWNVKFKPTYKHSKTAMLVFDAEEQQIVAYMSGTAENAYGTPDNISSSIKFSKTGQMIKDSDGLPDIMTY
jgi:hypothetical protein